MPYGIRQRFVDDKGKDKITYAYSGSMTVPNQPWVLYPVPELAKQETFDPKGGKVEPPNEKNMYTLPNSAFPQARRN